MAKNLFVGNLPEAINEADLKTSFEQAGSVVSANIIKNRHNGLSRGFAFIEMGTEKEAKEAIRRFDKGKLQGNTVRVNEARPKPNFF